MNANRRQFLKVASLSAMALSSGMSTLCASEALAQIAPGKYEKGEKTRKAKRWAMVIDTRKFSGEKDYAPLIEACHKAHNVPNIPGDKNIKWFWLDSYAHTFPDDMNDHMSEKITKAVYPLLCNHCTNPPCVRVCPTQTTFKRPDGIVMMDYHRCIGCRFCMSACPYGARNLNFMDPRPYVDKKTMNPGYPTRSKGVVEKCTLCYERIDQGFLPVCVEASYGCLIFGDLTDETSEIRQALANAFSIRRRVSLGTGPNIYYIFDEDSLSLFTNGFNADGDLGFEGDLLEGGE